MEYVILDLEWNGTYSTRLKKYFNEIIEFGAVKFDNNMNIIDEFSMVVRPKIGKKICSKVKDLTNITNRELNRGKRFVDALEAFKIFLGDSVLMTWDTTDITVLMENNLYYLGTDRMDFLTKFMDLQKYCEYRLDYNDGKQLGLITAAEILGINVDENDYHRALEDSKLSLECLKRIGNLNLSEQFIQDASCDEFYDRISFKTSYICNLNSPLIDKSDLEFQCDECSCMANRISPWELKNKSHRARFLCPNCGNEFTARIQFKLKYEGIIIKKTCMPINKD